MALLKLVVTPHRLEDPSFNGRLQISIRVKKHDILHGESSPAESYFAEFQDLVFPTVSLGPAIYIVVRFLIQKLVAFFLFWISSIDSNFRALCRVLRLLCCRFRQ